MRGVPCSHHPAKVLGKKSSCCGRTDGAVEVEDHGNGFMFIGTSDREQARRLLLDYVEPEEASEHRFWARTVVGKDCAVWVSKGPADNWDGSKDSLGKPLPR